jgi:glycosyltransferase involved in cell wall biosynthesis
MTEMACHDEQLRILAFEPFDAGSHRAVRESITRHSQHHWTWITRPGRFWKWRIRTAAIEMIEAAREQGVIGEPGADRAGTHQAHDVIFASSLLSVADLRALLPSHLRRAPIVLSMHENQAAYPAGHRTDLSAERDLQFPLTNLTSVLAADAVIWNSAWNRDSFISGIDRILRLAPDGRVPHDIDERVRSKSCVIWPPVEWQPDESLRERVLHNAEAGSSAADNHKGGAVSSADASASNPIRIVWPHRWEHDKGPDELLDIARRYTASLNIRWTILGERFRQVPEAMLTFEHEFADRIDHFGFEPDRQEYLRHLARCDWVLSTARHEFFGIAVVEALLAGCLPWLPDRLSYPELLPPEARGLDPTQPPADIATVRDGIRRHLGPAVAPNAVGELDRRISLIATAQRQVL